MKKQLLKFAGAALLCGTLLTSCYTYTSVVGTGAQGNSEVKQANHYLIGGLVPLSVSDSNAMAAGAENYEVITEQTFVDGLLSAITGGIYTPSTTIVRK